MSEATPDGVPLSDLPPEEKARRAGSFGAAASRYERFRPGPASAVVDWFLPAHVGTVVDLGAGTGALTRLLVGRADDVVAVEPDDRMRAVLAEAVPDARPVAGRGESMPLPDGSADAVLASSSWHWVDPMRALPEVARVLVPGGVLGAVWSGPDPEGPFIVEAQSLLADNAPSGEFGDLLQDARRRAPRLEIPAGMPFETPEHESATWDIALDADELIGLLGTFSWFITMPEDRQARVAADARRLLAELMGVEGEVTIDVAFRSDAWRTRSTR